MKIKTSAYCLITITIFFLSAVGAIFFYWQKTLVVTLNPAIIKNLIAYNYPLPLKTPTKVKAIYLTGYSFASQPKREEITNLITQTELNAIVIDIKDSSNRLMFSPSSPRLKKLPVSKAALTNEKIKQILDEWQRQKIYTIARITTFQDNAAAKAMPNLALKKSDGNLWQNWQGVTWLDMTDQRTWKLPLMEAKEAAALGFDEIQFDYIRFPSDGNTAEIKYLDLPANKKRTDVMVEFYRYLDRNLAETNIPISADLFGLTYQRHSNPDYDLNIGQKLTDAAPYFDFLSPMVYPSHYPAGFLDLANPAEHPYIIVNHAMREGKIILANVPDSRARTRPWLQDFDLGANYDAKMVRDQITACDENETAGWILWNPKNIYTVEALAKEETF